MLSLESNSRPAALAMSQEGDLPKKTALPWPWSSKTTPTLLLLQLLTCALHMVFFCSLERSRPITEEDMATHSSVLAWRIPWTEESGRLQHRVVKSQTRLKWLSMHACRSLISTKRTFKLKGHFTWRCISGFEDTDSGCDVSCIWCPTYWMCFHI